MRDPYFICIGRERLGWGWTPQQAFRRFWREVWRTGLAAVVLPQSQHTWLERECMSLAANQQPMNWHRAYVSLLERGEQHG